MKPLVGLVAPQTLELLRSNAVRGDHARVILILFRVIPRLRGAFLKPKAFYMGYYYFFMSISHEFSFTNSFYLSHWNYKRIGIQKPVTILTMNEPPTVENLMETEGVV